MREQIFLGGGERAGIVTFSVLPPPYNQLLQLLTPYFKMVLKKFLYDSHLLLSIHFKLVSRLPLPPPLLLPPPIKNYNQALRQCCHGPMKIEFTVKGELTYWQDQFVIVHNSATILYLKVFVTMTTAEGTDCPSTMLAKHWSLTTFRFLTTYFFLPEL